MPETVIRCGDPQLDAMTPRIRQFLGKSVASYTMMGKPVRGFRSPDSPSIWIRDHSDILRGGKYWEKDLQGVLDHFAETQSARGWFFDNFAVKPEKPPCERENWARYIRVPVEADVEFRFVKAVFLTWQATGDDGWLRRMVAPMEKGLAYILTDPWRWDRATRLVKRAYTVDTWDFDYTAGRNPWLNFQIDEHTFWGIMHGDNSGYFQAFVLLARMLRHIGRHRKAASWERGARALRARANRLCFNGRFYTHRIPITPVSIPGVNEAEQLSLSNPMDINRGMASHAMAVAILGEYQKREKETGAFAPWFSIDPPFPDGIFGEEKLVGGAYCNGGIMPLVGGELARAAMEHGFERFGVSQLRTYARLIEEGSSYLWYFPDGRHSTVETSTSPEALPTDPWGSSAMLYALAEGLAGVVDRRSLFRDVELAPRWEAAECNEAEVSLSYAASGASFVYSYRHEPARGSIVLHLQGKAKVHIHLLLPPGGSTRSVRVNGRSVRWKRHTVEQSNYVDTDLRVEGKAEIAITYVSRQREEL